MPSGTCNYPDHHGPGKGGPVGLLAAIVIGALIVAYWHTVVLVAVVVVVLALATVAVAMLWHSHTAEPYDAGLYEQEPQRAIAAVRARVPAELPHAARRAISAPAPAVHVITDAPARVLRGRS